jgi:hypothetical protein
MVSLRSLLFVVVPRDVFSLFRKEKCARKNILSRNGARDAEIWHAMIGSCACASSKYSANTHRFRATNFETPVATTWELGRS